MRITAWARLPFARGAGAWCVGCLLAGALEAAPFTIRVPLRDYAAEEAVGERPGGAFDETVRLPFAFGLHHRQGEASGYRRLLAHVYAEADGWVDLKVNRLFEAVNPACANPATGTNVPGVRREVRAGWNWVDFPIAGRREMRFELAAAGAARCDIAVLTKSADFDPSPLDADGLNRETDYRRPRTEYADRLFERNPLMPIEAYVAAVAAHLGAKPQPPVAMTDENGALLHDGKPFFPLMVFHSTFGADEALFNGLPVNLFPDRIPEGKGPVPRFLHSNALAGADTCYEEFARRAREQDSDWVVRHTGILYLFDEPDALYDALALRRLHRLFKCFVPRIPTACCFCTFATPPETYRACDCASFDHYPIGMRDPWCSVEVIGWAVDRMRWATGGSPVFMTIQVFDQNDPGHYEGGNVNPAEGFPTEREMNAMAFLAVAHGVRGLYFYNWRGLHNGHYESMAQLHPEGYANFRRLLFRLHGLERCLVGPDVRSPWRGKGEAKTRVLVSGDRREAYLLAVNPTLHDVRQRLELVQLAFREAELEEVFNFGVAVSQADGAVELGMEELGSVLFRIRSERLGELAKKGWAEVQAELKERALSDPGRYTSEAARLGRRGQKRRK